MKQNGWDRALACGFSAVITKGEKVHSKLMGLTFKKRRLSCFFSVRLKNQVILGVNSPNPKRSDSAFNVSPS